MRDDEGPSFQLEKFGLTPVEIRVYFRLFALGSTTLDTIARDLSVDRGQVFRVLERLIEKQMIFSILGKPKKYAARDPNTALHDLLEVKRMELQTLETKITEVNSQLTELGKIKKNLPCHSFRRLQL